MSPDGQPGHLAPDAPDRDATIRRSVKICNQKGLHARAAARFVHLAGTFGAQVLVDRAGWTIDGKSIMGLLLLAASRGTSITISADGPDEAAAVVALSALVERGFDEESACSS